LRAEIVIACPVATGVGALITALLSKAGGSPNDSFGAGVNRFADEIGQLIPLVIGEVVNSPCDCERAIEGSAVAERSSAR
jgi:hypothetical protein